MRRATLDISILLQGPGIQDGILPTFNARIIISSITQLVKPQLLVEFLSYLVGFSHLKKHGIAIELLCAAQGLDLFTNQKPGAGTGAAYAVIRNAVPHLEHDRILSDDVRNMVALMREGAIMAAVEDAVGPVI